LSAPSRKKQKKKRETSESDDSLSDEVATDKTASLSTALTTTNVTSSSTATTAPFSIGAAAAKNDDKGEGVRVTNPSFTKGIVKVVEEKQEKGTTVDKDSRKKVVNSQGKETAVVNMTRSIDKNKKT